MYLEDLVASGHINNKKKGKWIYKIIQSQNSILAHLSNWVPQLENFSGYRPAYKVFQHSSEYVGKADVGNGHWNPKYTVGNFALF